MGDSIEGGGVAAIGSLANSAQIAQAPTLDALSADAIRSEQIKGEIESGGEQVLSVVTEFQFESDVTPRPTDEKGNLGPSDEIDKHASELTGREPGEGAVRDERTQATADLVRDLYLASAKTLVAWKVLDGVGKDTKVMLQAQ